MIYQGSKERLSKELLHFIQGCIDEKGIDTYVEPFVGGANMIDKVKCPHRLGIDSNHYVITLLDYMKCIPDLKDFSDTCSFEHYKDVRDSYNNKDDRYNDINKAVVGYFASYGGRFFDGGYGRDRTGRNMYKERLTKARKQAPLLKDIDFVEGDYSLAQTLIPSNKVAMVYCDPPYANTKSYNHDFDPVKFCRWAEEMSKEHFVLISEYSMPDDFVRIWKKERKVMQKSDRDKAMTFTEGLWTLKDGKYYKWFCETIEEDFSFLDAFLD